MLKIHKIELYSELIPNWQHCIVMAYQKNRTLAPQERSSIPQPKFVPWMSNPKIGPCPSSMDLQICARLLNARNFFRINLKGSLIYLSSMKDIINKERFAK